MSTTCSMQQLPGVTPRDAATPLALLARARKPPCPWSWTAVRQTWHHLPRTTSTVTRRLSERKSQTSALGRRTKTESHQPARGHYTLKDQRQPGEPGTPTHAGNITNVDLGLCRRLCYVVLVEIALGCFLTPVSEHSKDYDICSPHMILGC